MSENLALVTGAAGFIGSNIAVDLARDHDVVVCDTFGETEQWRYLARTRLHDIIRPEVVLDWVERHAGRIAAVVHMGAISATTERDVDRIVAANIRLTLDLWELCARHGIPFVYASSAATYGDGSRGFVDDDSPEGLARLEPLNAYGWSKHTTDRRIVDDVVNGRPAPPRWAGLKFFNVYGPNEGHKGSMRSVVHQIYPVAMRGEPVRLFKSDHPDYADGGQLRDFVYVKDCAAVVRAMLDAPELGGVFNVGTGRARSFADLAAAVFAAIGREPRIEYVDMPEALRGRYQYFTEADTTKITGAGLAPSWHDIEAGVGDYVRSHLVRELADA
jgi:ADP-L-glycero-D-manno-heptose 6-epimerase